MLALSKFHAGLFPREENIKHDMEKPQTSLFKDVFPVQFVFIARTCHTLLIKMNSLDRHSNAVYAEVTDASNNYIMTNNISYEDSSSIVAKQSDGKSRTPKCTIALSIAIILLVLSLGAVIIVFSLEISMLKSGQQLANTSLADLDQQFAQENLAVDNRIQDLTISSGQLSDNISALTARLSEAFMAFTVPSCAALPPSSPSGYYSVRDSTGSAVRVYCDMTRSCGGVIGGWMRVAELDMTNSNHQCPSGLVQPS